MFDCLKYRYIICNILLFQGSDPNVLITTIIEEAKKLVCMQHSNTYTYTHVYYYEVLCPQKIPTNFAPHKLKTGAGEHVSYERVQLRVKQRDRGTDGWADRQTKKTDR